MSQSTYINESNPFNAAILSCLALPLGKPTPKLVTYFQECIVKLNEEVAGIGEANNFPVYADPTTGIILAAVCGAKGVALRIAPGLKRHMIKEGCTEYVEYKASRLPFAGVTRFPLVGVAGNEGDGWVVCDGSLADRILTLRVALMMMRQALRPVPEKVSKAPTTTTLATIDIPANTAVLNYLKTLKPDGGTSSVDTKDYGPYGGYHPDVSDFLWNTLTKKAGVEVEGWLIFSKLGIVHPTSRVICAVMRDEGVFAMRLPDTARAIADGAKAYPEIGDGWIYFPLFSLQEHSAQWLAQSYQYAATL